MTNAEITLLCEEALAAARVTYAAHPVGGETLDGMVAEMEDYLRTSGVLMDVTYRRAGSRVVFAFSLAPSVQNTAFDLSVDI